MPRKEDSADKLPAESPLINYDIKKRNFSPLLRQIIAVMGPVTSVTCAGHVTGYTSTMLPELKNDTSIELSPAQESWIASFAALQMAVGCFIGGALMEKYGRRSSQQMCLVPMFLGWVLIYFATNVWWLLFGRIFNGLSVGMLGPPCSIYIGESTEPRYRGFMLATISMAVAFGILQAHTFGTFLDWRTTALACAGCCVFSYLYCAIIPESPAWLLRKNRLEDATKSFQWLRGFGPAAVEEFEAMCVKHKLDAEKKDPEQSYWTTLRKNFQQPQFAKPFGIILVYFATMQFSGPNAVAFYSVEILKSSLGGEINEYFAMIMLDLLRLVMSVLACILLRLYGRRILTIISGIGTASFLFSFFLFLFFSKQIPAMAEYSWVNLILLMGYIFFISIGIFPLPWCIMGEILPVAGRGVGSGLTAAFNFFCFFIVVKTAPGMYASSLGIEGTFLCYGIFVSLGTIFMVLFLPETKNKTLLEIEANFVSRKPKPNVTN